MALPATDAFTGTNGTALTTYSASWTMNHGAMQIQSNGVAGNTAGDDAMAHWNADTFSDDQYAQATIVASSGGDNVGPSARCDASAFTGYNFSSFGSSYELYKIIAGSFTSLGNNLGGALNDIMRIECSGTTITCKINGSVAAFGAKTDSAISSGYGGLGTFNNNTGSRLDDWEAGNLGGAATGTFPFSPRPPMSHMLIR